MSSPSPTPTPAPTLGTTLSPALFDITGIFGEGSYSEVQDATRRDTGERFALKVMSKRRLLRRPQELEAVRRERELLGELAAACPPSPRLARLCFSFQDEHSIYLALRPVGRGTELYQLIQRWADYTQDDKNTPPRVPRGEATTDEESDLDGALADIGAVFGEMGSPGVKSEYDDNGESLRLAMEEWHLSRATASATGELGARMEVGGDTHGAFTHPPSPSLFSFASPTVLSLSSPPTSLAAAVPALSSLRTVRYLLAQIVLMIRDLRDRFGLVHRDIKPENLILNDDGHLVLVDFGCAARLADLEREQAEAEAGTEASTARVPAVQSPPTEQDRQRCRAHNEARGGGAASTAYRPQLVGTAEYVPYEILAAGREQERDHASGRIEAEEEVEYPGGDGYRETTKKKEEVAEGGVQVYWPAYDLWALGCIVYQCLVGRPPFRGKTEYLTLMAIHDYQLTWPAVGARKKEEREKKDEDQEADQEGGTRGDEHEFERDKEPLRWDEISRDLVARLLTRRPMKRLGAGPRGIQEVMEHPFFASIDWAAMDGIPRSNVKEGAESRGDS